MSKELQKKYHEALQNVTRERNQLRRELEFAKSIIRILQAKGDSQWNQPKSQLIYKNACLSEGIEKLQIENEELRVQNEALEIKINNIKESMGDLDFYYKEKLEILQSALKEACETVKYYEEMQDKEVGFYDSCYDLDSICNQYIEVVISKRNNDKGE